MGCGLLGLLLNISSIRHVTKKPPKILTEAMTMATKLIKAIKLKLSTLPKAMIAPTMTTAEMALVTDINGVCRAGVTFQTTKYPTKHAKIKMLIPNERADTATIGNAIAKFSYFIY